MIKIAILGDIGSGKSYVANKFGYPVFSADNEVNKIYKKNKLCFNKLKKKLPKYIFSFPINKKELSAAIINNENNLKKINKIVHPIVRKKMKNFFKKNKNKKIVILDIPLFVENKMNNKSYKLVFVEANKREIQKRLKKRKNYKKEIVDKLKKFQLSLIIKRRISQYIIKNDFKNSSIKKKIKMIKKAIL